MLENPCVTAAQPGPRQRAYSPLVLHDPQPTVGRDGPEWVGCPFPVTLPPTTATKLQSGFQL